MIEQGSILLIKLIRVGVVFRVGYSFLKMMENSDETSGYLKRIKNVLVFYVIAESIFHFRDIAIYYFKYGGNGGPM